MSLNVPDNFCPWYQRTSINTKIAGSVIIMAIIEVEFLLL